ncbi:MAG TPA: NTP transferase domain-containing protein [Syntrophales bacterium]|nr:NTP transferase domain-containing protein [Syntrophales bacterium]
MTQYEEREISAIILAAGKGKRMKSGLAKVLHPICGKPMLTYSVDVARAVGVGKIAVVIGHQADVIRDAFRDQGLIFVEQREQLGTGHAVLQAKNTFHNFDGTILILCGDVPLLLPSTVKSLIESHFSGKATLTVLTTLLDDPSGYGRVIKGAEGEVLRIVEEKDASCDEKKIREINTGIYCVECKFLFQAVEEIGNENVQKEYYLTDIVGIACRKGFKTRSLIAADSIEVMGVNTLDDLKRASAYMSCK